MVAEYLSVGYKAIFAILKFVPRIAMCLWNYWKRPNLKLSAINSHIEFCSNDSKRFLPSFPSIRIKNIGSTDVTFDLNQFSLNGESLSYIIQQNKYFARTNDQTGAEYKLTTKNELLTTFRENWTSSKFLKLPAHEYLDVPIYPQGMGDSTYFKVISSARVFFPKGKIVIILTANSQVSHYAVNRMEFLRIILNCLVHNRGE